MGWNHRAFAILAMLTVVANMAMIGLPPASPQTDDEGTETTIEITSPQQDEEFQPGEVVPIHGNATGDIESINVTVGAQKLDVEGEENWETNWTARQGVDSITVRATATGPEGQTAQQSVTITVAEPDPGPPVDPDPEPEENGDVEIPAAPTSLLLALIAGASVVSPRWR